MCPGSRMYFLPYKNTMLIGSDYSIEKFDMISFIPENASETKQIQNIQQNPTIWNLHWHLPVSTTSHSTSSGQQITTTGVRSASHFCAHKQATMTL
mmetsp:Transcript_187/g.409  ORF Transcript_187/g.409 Transcript_187/m.409 type:complete len:96 (-) Transcript_187:4-291(-)